MDINLQPRAAAATSELRAYGSLRLTDLYRKRWQLPEQSHQINIEVTVGQEVHTKLIAEAADAKSITNCQLQTE